MTKTTRAPRVAELAADEGYNLQGAPVLLAKLTAYVGRATFAHLRAISTSTGGEYSAHLSAFMWPADCHAARESFAAQARVILSNPPTIPPAVTAARARRSAAAQAIDTTPSQERPAAWTAYAAACDDEARIVAESPDDQWTVIPGPTPAEMDRRDAREERYRSESRRQYFEEARAPGPATTQPALL